MTQLKLHNPYRGFFYPVLRSTIVRMVLPSFVLLVIKGLLKAYHREDLIAALVDYQVHLRYATFVYLPTRAIEISFNPLNLLPSAFLGRLCMLSLMLGAGGSCLYRGCSSYEDSLRQERPLLTWRSTLATTH